MSALRAIAWPSAAVETVDPFEPCLSASEQVMLSVVSAAMRRAPSLRRNPEAILRVASTGIGRNEPDREMVDRRAHRVLRMAVARFEAARRARANEGA